jgi:hypothetical protein
MRLGLPSIKTPLPLLRTTKYIHQPSKKMRSVLTWVAILLIVLWLVGYIGFSEVVGSFIHAALALAFVAILARILTRRRSV